MLLPYKDLLKTKNILLGSKSARRKDLVGQMGLDVQIYPSNFEENLPKESFQDPLDYVKATCQGKVNEVIERSQKENVNWDIAIFGDTVCLLDGQIIEKPQSEEHVQQMIRNFSGRQHQVITVGITVIKQNDGKIKQDIYFEKTNVNFAQIPEETIVAYSKTEYPWGKAGAYGYQDIAGSFVQGIDGDFYNVVGLPVHRLAMSIIELMKQANWI